MSFVLATVESFSVSQFKLIGVSTVYKGLIVQRFSLTSLALLMYGNIVPQLKSSLIINLHRKSIEHPG